MKGGRYSTIFLLSLASCVDLSEKQVVGPYYLAADPAGPDETLSYSLPNGLMAERIRNVKKAGHSPAFLFVKSVDSFYYIVDRAQDRASDLGDPEVRKAISKPLTEPAFRRALDSLGVGSFPF